MPVIFYFKAKELLFPSLQDLIIQNVIDNKKVLEEADPQMQKAAEELFKQKQQAVLKNWDEEYNNFQRQSKSAISMENQNNTPEKEIKEEEKLAE